MTVSFSLLFSGCSAASSSRADEDGSAAGSSGPPPSPPALVRVADVREERIAQRLLAVGTVRARHYAEIASAADGVVAEFSVEHGMFITEGTELSKLRMEATDLALDEQRAILDERQAYYEQTLSPRTEDVEEAKAQQQATEAAYANAARRLSELRDLATRGAINPSAVQDAEDAEDEARQRMLAAQAVAQRVAAGTREEEKLQAKARLLAQQKHVAFLEAERQKRITRAPFDGFVVQEHTYLGQWLSKGDPVVTMAQLDEVDVRVPVDQTFISQVRIGDSIRLKIAGTPDPSAADGHWTGTVHQIISRSDWESGSRSFPVIVRVANKIAGTAEVPVPALREGMMAEAEFFGDELEAVLVPKDALTRTSRGTFVFALIPPESDQPPTVRQVQVEPGISKDEWIQVSGSDLAAGMQVVTEGAERLRPFQSVQIISETAEPSGASR